MEIDSSRAGTVWARVTERNEFITAFGLDSLRHPLRIVVRDSVVHRIEPAEPNSKDPFGGRLAPFFAWISEECPEASRLLVDDSGRTVYGNENGLLLLELAREWNRMNSETSSDAEG